MALQDYLDQAIKKVCPIHGISFGKLDDKKTWVINYAEEANEEQRQEAQKILDEFFWDEAKQKEHEDYLKVQKYKDDLAIKAAFIEHKLKFTDAKFIDYINHLESIEV